jgi:hypothetical protein
MKRTSRRDFGKQLTAALAAVPVSSLVLATPKPIERKKPPQDKVKKKNEHNTPPPLNLGEGSMIIEAFTERADWSGHSHTQGRRKWSIVPKPYEHIPNMPPTNLYIEYVKIVDGAGERVYTLDNDSDRSLIEIEVRLQKQDGTDFGDLLITVTGDHYELSVPESKRIKKKSGDPPSNARRKRIRYMHETGSNADQCEWARLIIRKGGQEVFNQNPTEWVQYAYREMRVMIWWTNFPTP